MVTNKIKILLGASALLFSSLSHSSLITDTVSVDGTIWAQPTGFLGLSWDSINEVCPEDSSGICKAEQLLGNDMHGWVWASMDDVANLLVSLDVPLDLREVDSSWAPVVMNTFNSVSGLSNEVVWGMSRTSHPDANFAAFAPFIIDGNDGLIDVVNIGNPDDKSIENFSRGGWFYREISPVPVPAAIWLFGSGLLSLIGFARRKA